MQLSGRAATQYPQGPGFNLQHRKKEEEEEGKAEEEKEGEKRSRRATLTITTQYSPTCPITTTKCNRNNRHKEWKGKRSLSSDEVMIYNA